MARLSVPRPLRRAQRSLRDRMPNFRVHRTGLIAFLAVLGPGIIAGLAGNDAGGIATYSVMGAETGLSLLWILPLTTMMLAIVLEMAARMGAVSGQGLGDLIRDDFGIRWTAVAMLVVLVANGMNIVAEFAGAGAALEIFGIPRFVTVPVVAAAIWALVVFASYRVVERVFLSVAVVFIAYVVSAFVVGPDWGAVARSLVVPSVSLEPSVLLLMVTAVGTTVTPYMFFYLQSSVADKGLGPEELRFEQADAVLGAVWTNVIALFIIIATATTIFGTGLRIESAAGRRVALQPLAGDAAGALFAFGLFGASVLAATVMPLTTSYAVCESFGWESGVSRALPRGTGLHGPLHRPDRHRRAGGADTGTAAHRPDPGQPAAERHPAAGDPGLHAAAGEQPAHHGPLHQPGVAQRRGLGTDRAHHAADARPLRERPSLSWFG